MNRSSSCRSSRNVIWRAPSRNPGTGSELANTEHTIEKDITRYDRCTMYTISSDRNRGIDRRRLEILFSESVLIFFFQINRDGSICTHAVLATCHSWLVSYALYTCQYDRFIQAGIIRQPWKDACLWHTMQVIVCSIQNRQQN